MASVNEEVNFNVNFNDSDINKTTDNLNSVQAALNKLEQSTKELNKLDLSDTFKLSETPGVLKLLKTQITNIKDAIAALKSDTSGVNYKSQISELNTELTKTKNLMSEVASSMPVTRASNADVKEVGGVAQSDDSEKMRYNYEEAERTVREIFRERQRVRAEAESELKAEQRLNAERESAYSNIRSELSQLESGANDVESAYNDAFSRGDFSGIRNANNQLVSLRNRAAELRNEISRASSMGVDTSELEANLSEIESRINSIANNSSSRMREGFVSGFKSAVSKLDTIATSFSKRLYNTAVSLTRSWGNVLSRTFSSVVSGWKKMLSGVFTRTNNQGYLTSQIKSLMGVASIAGLVALGKQAVELSSSLFEVQNVIDNVFPNATADINDFCDNAAYKFGLTSLEAKKMIGVFGGMLSAANITGDAQKEMSKNLTALVGDLSSFYNLSTSDVYAKLQSGLQGNTAAMRSFGVSMTVANLEAYALSQGITTSYQDMDQATKTTLRYNYMLNQLSVAQGDFARTAGSWSNQVRSLSSNFQQLLSILGGGIIKALYPALTVLNQIVAAAVNAANALAKLFGFSAIDLGTLFGGTGAVADLGDYSSGLEDVADATDDVAGATAKANENLQTFDKLNNVQTPTSGGGAGGAGGVGGAGGLIDFESYYDSIGDPKQVMNKRLQAIIDTLKDFAKDIASVDYSQFAYSWKKMINALDPLISDLGDGIIWLWKKVLFPFYKWGIEAGAPAVFDVITEGLYALHEIIRAVSPEIDKFWDSTLAPFFSNKGDQFVALMKLWKTSLRNWTNGLKESDDKLKYLSDTISTLKEKLYNWIDDEEITSRLDSIGDHFKGIFRNLISKDTMEQAKSLLRTFTKLNLIVFDNILKVIEYLTGNTKVTSFVEFLVEQFGDLADYTFDAIIDIIDYVAGSDDAREIIVNIKEAIKNIIDWVVEHKETIISLLERVSDILLWVSEHINMILIAFSAIKGVGLFVNLISGLSDFKTSWVELFGSSGKLVRAAKKASGKVLSTFKNAFGEIKIAGGEMWTAITGSAGAWAIPLAGVAAVTVGVGLLGKAAKDYRDAVIEAEEEFDKSLTKSQDVINNLSESSEHLFEDSTGNVYDYVDSLQDVTDAFNDMSEKTKTAVATGGLDVLFSREDNIRLKEDAQNYVNALRECGYANDDLMDKIEELATMRVQGGADVVEDWRTELLGALRQAQTEVNTEVGSLRDITDEELNNVTNNFAKNGADAPSAYADNFTDNLVYIDIATGQLYDRLNQTYTEITDESELAGRESIVGYVEGANGEKDFLVTETGNIIDAVTGVVMKMPEEWRDLAKSSIDGMALEFNSDGSVKNATKGLITTATDTAKSMAEVGANATSNAFLKTTSSKISSDTSINKSLTSNVKGAGANAAAEATKCGESMYSSYTIGAVNRFNSDTELKPAVSNAVSGALEDVGSNVEYQGNVTGGNIIQGIIDGIWGNVSGLWNTISSVGSNLLTKFKDVLGIHSPSRAFANLAKFIPTGVSKGVSDNAEYAYDSVNDLANGMLKTFEDTDLDMSSIIDSSKFSDKYKDILYETDIFTKDMKSKYGNLSAFDMQANMIVSPSVKKAELAANVAQSSTTSRLAEGVSALYNRVGSAASSGANQLVCNLILSGEKMATFVIDTINGNVVQTGNF